MTGTDTIRHTFTSRIGITGVWWTNIKTVRKSEAKVFWCDKSEMGEGIIFADEENEYYSQFIKSDLEELL